MMDILSSFIMKVAYELAPSSPPISLGLLGTNFMGSNSELFFEIFRTGLFHGIFFSLPFSIPMLICFRRYILDGVSLGNYAFAGTLLGHLSFLFCTITGIRPIIHFWYPLEPLLSFLGLALSLKVATDFFSQRRFVFDGTLGSSEDSSAYAMNPWPKIPEISWLFSTELKSKTPKILLQFLRFPKTVFSGLQQTTLGYSLRKFWSLLSTILFPKLQAVGIPFQKFQNFYQKNLGPSIFTFQFFLMWLNPASASTLNLLFFEHEILQRIFISPNSPIFLFYTIGFISAAVALFTFILFFIYQLSGRNFVGIFQGTHPTKETFGPAIIKSTLLERALRIAQLDEALAQNRFKIFNKFFAFIIIGFVIQGGLNYTWRLFLQYPLEMIHWDFFTTWTKKLKIFANPSIDENMVLTAPKDLFQKSSIISQDLMSGSIPVPSANDLGFPFPILRPDELKLAASPFISKAQKLMIEGPGSRESKNTQPEGWFHDSEGATPTRDLPDPLSSEQAINFFGRREFPPYDTSIRNREKNLPVERHLAIERVNSRRGLMGRPPLENEERENAIFKYHTFFMNQIDRSVEDLKMKLVTPPDLYREENDILALQKLHQNYLKQKGRESEYQNSVINPVRGNAALGLSQKFSSFPRHDRDFFTKSRPVTNTTKGLSKSSYIRDLFDPNLQAAYSAYSHDDLLLEKIISNSALPIK